MKKIGLFLLINVMVISGFAQRRGNPLPPDDRAENVITRLEEKITFSTAERDSMVIIYTGFFKEMEPYRGQRNFEKIRELAELRDKKVKELLSEEQFEKYLDVLEENRQQMRRRRRP